MAGLFASVVGLFGGTRSQATEYKIADIYRDLRRQVVELNPSAIGLVPSKTGRVWAVLMETGYPEAVASLVTIADGTVSLYFSNGGGIIGVGEHEGPHRTSKAFLSAAPQFLSYLKPTKEFPLPKQGNTRFYLLTFDGAFTAEAPEQDLGEGRLPLSSLFLKGHEVITQARLADEKVRGSGTAIKAAPDQEARFAELMHSVTTGDIETLRKLLQSRVNINESDQTGLTPLMGAAYMGQDGAVKILLDSGSEIEAKDSSGYTALMFAANAGHIDSAKVLVTHGARVEAQDNTGSTPLMFAAQHGHNEIVRLLLSKGASPTRQGKHGLSAIGFAVQNGHRDTETILKNKH